MAHWFVSSHRGESKCYPSAMDAVRAQILRDLAKGLAIYVETGDGDIHNIACAIEDASECSPDRISVGDRWWVLQECQFAMCRDIVRETAEW